MFTGLVESLVPVKSVSPDGTGGCLLVLVEPALASQISIGESIAVNGTCLTVVSRDETFFSFECGPETLQRTNLGRLKSGDRVNVERSLKIGDRLGGHLVTGHIDGFGGIAQRQKQGEFEMVSFSSPRELMRQVVPKGSIAVDGISLTVMDVTDSSFSVMLIPYTLANQHDAWFQGCRRHR
jgi:riboflavin synthase